MAVGLPVLLTAGAGLPGTCGGLHLAQPVTCGWMAGMRISCVRGTD